jgi:hypothetical protein
MKEIIKDRKSQTRRIKKKERKNKGSFPVREKCTHNQLPALGFDQEVFYFWQPDCSHFTYKKSTFIVGVSDILTASLIKLFLPFKTSLENLLAPEENQLRILSPAIASVTKHLRVKTRATITIIVIIAFKVGHGWPDHSQREYSKCPLGFPRFQNSLFL